MYYDVLLSLCYDQDHFIIIYDDMTVKCRNMGKRSFCGVKETQPPYFRSRFIWMKQKNTNDIKLTSKQAK